LSIGRHNVIKTIYHNLDLVILGIIAIYLTARLIGHAIAKSWYIEKYAEKNQHQPKQEETNENKKQK